MIRTAVSVAPETLLLLGVTVLTSTNSETLREIGITEDVSPASRSTGENRSGLWHRWRCRQRAGNRRIAKSN